MSHLQEQTLDVVNNGILEVTQRVPHKVAQEYDVENIRVGADPGAVPQVSQASTDAGSFAAVFVCAEASLKHGLVGNDWASHVCNCEANVAARVLGCSFPEKDHWFHDTRGTVRSQTHWATRNSRSKL